MGRPGLLGTRGAHDPTTGPSQRIVLTLLQPSAAREHAGPAMTELKLLKRIKKSIIALSMLKTNFQNKYKGNVGQNKYFYRLDPASLQSLL